MTPGQSRAIVYIADPVPYHATTYRRYHDPLPPMPLGWPAPIHTSFVREPYTKPSSVYISSICVHNLYIKHQTKANHPAGGGKSNYQGIRFHPLCLWTREQNINLAFPIYIQISPKSEGGLCAGEAWNPNIVARQNPLHSFPELHSIDTMKKSPNNFPQLPHLKQIHTKTLVRV